ncbi:MAG TPA: preprotein translocase subunit SecY [Candidatus Paceibacterota bacterium]|nr:preprotein translocase subunit SecY [Candidatus Paceibacterota bacterium]
MSKFTEKLKLVFGDEDLRKRIFFVLGCFALFRLLAAIPIPGVNSLMLQSFLQNNQFLGLLNIFSGGGLSTLSIVMMGVGPFITSSIIMQLLTIMSPKLKALYQEEGEAGRRKFAQYSRLLTVPLAIIQAYGFLILLERQGIIPGLTNFQLVVNLFVATAGSILLMWIGELINEFGVGNGVSLLIFAGILARLPASTGQLAFAFDATQLPLYAAFLVAALVVIFGVVIVTEAERPIPVTYAKRVRGNKVYGGVSTYLPLRLNQAGVIPIIFALSILLFPQMIFNFLTASTNSLLASIAQHGVAILNNSWLYAAIYFVLVFIFTFFYTAITFDPEQVATNLQKNGAFVPGVRPGLSTSEYLADKLTKLTIFGAIFLGLIAVLPLVMRAVTGITSLAIGGTALLIVVQVIVDLIKRIDAQVSIREY